MNPDTITWIWVWAGVLLMVAEFIVPGLVVVFLGAAAMLVGLGRWLNLLEGVVSSFIAWFILSLGLIIALRQLLARLVPAESSYQSPDEDLNALGSLVDVLEPVEDQHSEGRIRYQGTSWPAISQKGSIPRGGKARLLFRENLVWVVEPLPEDELLPPIE